MSAPTTRLTGDALLVGGTGALVALHQRYHHRMTVTAKTLLLGGDLLACVLGGVYADVEKTMIELQRTTSSSTPAAPSRRRCRQVHHRRRTPIRPKRVWRSSPAYITHAKNGVRFSQLERQRLRGIRHAGSEPTTNQEVTAA